MRHTQELSQDLVVQEIALCTVIASLLIGQPHDEPITSSLPHAGEDSPQEAEIGPALRKFVCDVLATSDVSSTGTNNPTQKTTDLSSENKVAAHKKPNKLELGALLLYSTFRTWKKNWSSEFAKGSNSLLH